MPSEPWTVGRLLQWTTDYLKAHGSQSPRLDAEVLLAEALGCQRIELYTEFETVPEEKRRTAFRELVRRRAEGTPVAYLVGRREFYSLSFRVGPEVLIPRPETELLVVALLDQAKSRGSGAPLAIADVGTGSGIIAICAAKLLPAARVTAIDASDAALALAVTNAAQHQVADRIEFLSSDLFSAVPAERRFDFIVSNPPYVAETEVAHLPRDVRDFEPRQALVAGPRGTEVIERLLPQAVQRLRPGGHLLMEIGPAIHEAVRALLAAEPQLEPGPVIKDLARLPRVVQARKRERIGEETPLDRS
ncbi:MAG: peptide chain release factor N(5)-glutamine methyltransferase [Thermoguttaceae bacterium]|jgi:release factor glutamine methyltransferase